MKKIIILTTTIATTITMALLANAPSINAAPATNFEAGRIIDDIVMANKAAMTVSQIQTFLDSKVATCDTMGTKPHSSGNGQTRAQYAAARGFPAPPYTCLKSFSENGKSSAQILYDAAQEFSINPQVIIALIQREQGLITDDWPWPNQYKSATGYGCPDTAPCDSNYYGFTNQVRNAAENFHMALTPGSGYWSSWILNADNQIPYSTNPSCGTGTVKIQNRATLALYTYTPFQPNSEVLKAGYGAVGSCGEGGYGNRNFYLYFTDWFGSTQRKLVKSPESTSIYIIENSTKRHFASEEIFLSYAYKWSDVLNISSSELSSIPDGALVEYNTNHRNDQLVRASGSTSTYLVKDGTKRHFASEEIFLSHKYKWSNIVVISPTEIKLIPDGETMPYNLGYRDGKLIKVASDTMIYFVEGDKKRTIPSEAVFFSHSYAFKNVVNISQAEIDLIPVGEPMPYNIAKRNGQLVKSASDTMIYFVEGDKKRTIPSEAVFFSHSYAFKNVVNISQAEIDLIPAGEDMTLKTN